MVDIADALRLLHPIIAVTVVFPLIGIVVRMAWQTRQRRLEVASGTKSKIPPIVGQEHVTIGRQLSAAVVGLSLLGLGHPIFSKMARNQTWSQDPFRAWFIVAMFAATIAAFVMLYNAKPKPWRAVFATLTSMGVIILGLQPEIFRRDNEWYISHFYFGMVATLLMIAALAMIQEIYQDRKNRWRTAHIVLNSIALLFFIGQGITGARDLLEIPLKWQEPYVGQLYEKQCQTQPCVVQPAPKP
jgi:peptidoglycan/LPS O-acetylase OafA/YrhL